MHRQTLLVSIFLVFAAQSAASQGQITGTEFGLGEAHVIHYYIYIHKICLFAPNIFYTKVCLNHSTLR